MAETLAQVLMRYTQSRPAVSVIRTVAGEIGILRSDHPKPPTHLFSKPSICIVAQGAKWATFGEGRLVYRAGEALVVGVATPSVGRVVEASPDSPCLVLAIELDLAIMRSLIEEMEVPPMPNDGSERSAFVVDIAGPLTDCAIRVVRLLDTPDALSILFPMLVREICYWLLAGPDGAKLVRISHAEGASQRVIAAVHHVRERFAETVRLEALAAVARMSPSVLHRRFKALTGQTPLQYQKQLRLLEARRLMIADGVSVESAAFGVGYESASQFSREYSRMFGASPKRDTRGDALSAAVRPPAGDPRSAEHGGERRAA
ncbi:AraC family transcriptional regulator [Chitinasiproducens palmae]|uniref:AraC-type DNA-binding protein n=1 Tax=Chitinasiproducens palmae TaxID=1770053 RepID=A0A1H2PUU7_9BURK|nr:AraC family transcriptional regulator [Chitinasiproducens palmae]SDV50627.1 AraC-type DNA-binding protein [Chitinasiproducens palmae]